MTSALWQEFLADRGPAARERLAVAYLPLVREQVRTLADRTPVRAEALECYALIGLMKAIEMFDPDRGMPFEPFARQRIRGAVSDYLRTLAVGRTRAGARMSGQTTDAARTVPAALRRELSGADGSRDVEIWRAIEALSPSQKLVIGLHDCEGITLEAIGRVLGISRRGTRTLRNEAVHNVRTHLSLRAWLDGDPPARAQVRTS